MDIYFERIRPLFDKSGLQDKQIEEALDLPRGVIYKWGTGLYKSYMKYIYQISLYFNVSSDYLLGKTDDPSPTGQNEKPAPISEDELPEELQEVIALYKKASPEVRTLMLTMLRAAEAQSKGQDDEAAEK